MSKSKVALEELRSRFLEPRSQSRPTPFYWWSGADLDLDRMIWHLDLLQEKGIGGTIICYAHRPDGTVDHESPEPFSDEWWGLLQKFVEASADRGLSVGICDYQVIGTILLRAASQTQGLNCGNLKNHIEVVKGPGIFNRPIIEANVLSRRALSPDGKYILRAASEDSGQITWNLPEGDWILSTATIEPGQIYLFESEFDPLHPDSGQAVIELFFRTFKDRLGSHLGTTFNTFFQDELELGLVTPMWNSLVGTVLEQKGFAWEDSIHLLWHGASSETFMFRGHYRDTVVNLLQENFFKPIFDWHEKHNTSLVMDQLSRGDLALGHEHYSDFMETMAWYQGPGNDDPDLTGPRNISAFRTSSSIAHLNGRPLVTNEAFHSSGWGVTPQMMLAGLNIAFAAGANQVVLHGLDYTLESGWWEWASPDFHFRQPWWDHSGPMWTYLTRISEILQAGKSAVEIALLDPTPELDFNLTSQSPAMVSSLIEQLSLSGLGVDLLPQAYLQPNSIEISSGDTSINARLAKYKVILIHGITVIRDSAYQALKTFVQSGGKVIIYGDAPARTEDRRLQANDFDSWAKVNDQEDLVEKIQLFFDVDVKVLNRSVNILQSHRHVEDTEIFFFANPGDSDISTDVAIRGTAELEIWDAWKGEFISLKSVLAYPNGSAGYRLFTLDLKYGESVLIIQSDEITKSKDVPVLHDVEISDFSSDWKLSLVANLDNRYFDYALDQQELGVASYHIDQSNDPEGPWHSVLVDHGARFQAFGPFTRSESARLESEISGETGFAKGFKWREYSMSHTSGIPQDSYLLDRMTGPHGLKGVPSEFLDPESIDADLRPGDVYFFRSFVNSEGGDSILRSAGRAEHKIWLNGDCVRESMETAAVHFPPWNLRDMSTEIQESKIELKKGLNEVIVQICVSASQPSRVAAAIGGKLVSNPSKARLVWWQGTDPAEKFFIHTKASEAWFRVQVPPGAKSALVKTNAKLDSPGSVEVIETNGVYKISIMDNQKQLIFRLSPFDGFAGNVDSGAIQGPIIWECEAGELNLGSWANCGLSDFSGLGIYQKELHLESSPPTFAELEIVGIEGTVRVYVNDSDVGIGYGNSARFRIDPWLSKGLNKIVIESANTLVNLFRRLPSPYSIMQSPGGGLAGVKLRLQK